MDSQLPALLNELPHVVAWWLTFMTLGGVVSAAIALIATAVDAMQGAGE